MAAELRRLGFSVGGGDTPVLPIYIGDEAIVFRVWRELFDAGVYTNAIVSPAVPEGRALLRTSFMATHTRDQLDWALERFAGVRRTIGVTALTPEFDATIPAPR
jgi:7-keto-8-aminopelargonate synthetase-like enzyme